LSVLEIFDPLPSSYLATCDEVVTFACWLFGATPSALACEPPCCKYEFLINSAQLFCVNIAIGLRLYCELGLTS